RRAQAIPLYYLYLGRQFGEHFASELLQRSIRVDGISALQSDETVKPAVLNGGQDVDVVQFTGARLLPARIVGNMEVINTGQVVGQIACNIAFRYLLVVHVEYELDVRASDRVDDAHRFIRALQEVSGVI